MQYNRFTSPALTSPWTLRHRPCFLAGKPISSPYVALLDCPRCGAGFYAELLLRFPTCPACKQGPLEEVRRFDLCWEPLWPFLGRRLA
jgi:hypothetical protein